MHRSVVSLAAENLVCPNTCKEADWAGMRVRQTRVCLPRECMPAAVNAALLELARGPPPIICNQVTQNILSVKPRARTGSSEQSMVRFAPLYVV